MDDVMIRQEVEMMKKCSDCIYSVNESSFICIAEESMSDEEKELAKEGKCSYYRAKTGYNIGDNRGGRKMKDNIDKSLVSEHIGETVIVAGVKFDIVEFDGIKDKTVMIKSEQTKSYYISRPEDTLYDVCNKLLDIMKRNCEIHDNAPLDTSFIEIPSCFMTALRYIMENYNHYTNRFSFEVEELYNLLNEFALEHDDKTLSKIVNSYSTGLKYNFITNEVIDD